MTEFIPIDISDLICMHDYADKYNYSIDLAYSSIENVLFGERIYKKDAKLWLYKDLANIVFIAADYCFTTYNLHFILYDGLRTIDAQEKMMQTQRARDNPHWTEPPRFLSPPGSGGHPRAMAIDVGLETPDGTIVDMGTAFDSMVEQSHRNYCHAEHIKKNRSMLDDSMLTAAKELQTPLFLLPEEWWDFRLPADMYNQYAPLSERDLPEHMRLTL